MTYRLKNPIFTDSKHHCMKKLLYILITTLCLITATEAQMPTRKYHARQKPHELYLQFGATHYLSDLYDLKLGHHFTLGYRYYLHRSFFTLVTVAFGKYYDKEQYIGHRIYRHYADDITLACGLGYHFYDTPKHRLYAQLQIGVHNADGRDDVLPQGEQAGSQQSFDTFGFALSPSIGYHFRITKNLSLGAEYSLAYLGDFGARHRLGLQAALSF